MSTNDDPFGAGFVISDRPGGLPMRSLITAGSYRSSGGHLMGTNCSCGVNLGTGKGSFCTGYNGGHDTNVCYCECHDTPFPAPGELPESGVVL